MAIAETTNLIHKDQHITPENLSFCETARKMKNLGICLILFGVAIIGGAVIGTLIFHAHQGIVIPIYHYLILTTIAAVGAALAFLTIYHGIKLQFGVYDKDPKYREARKQEWIAEFNKTHEPTLKFIHAQEKFPQHIDKGYITKDDINNQLAWISFSEPRFAEILERDIKSLHFNCRVIQASSFYTVQIEGNRFEESNVK